MNRNMKIELHDRIYVRITQDGITRIELSINNAASMTDLIGEIRYAARHIDGLAKMFVRNHTRGWSLEQPIKFYREGTAPRYRYRTSRRNPIEMGADYHGVAPRSQRSTVERSAHTIFPWETH